MFGLVGVRSSIQPGCLDDALACVENLGEKSPRGTKLVGMLLNCRWIASHSLVLAYVVHTLHTPWMTLVMSNEFGIRFPRQTLRAWCIFSGCKRAGLRTCRRANQTCRMQACGRVAVRPCLSRDKAQYSRHGVRGTLGQHAYHSSNHRPSLVRSVLNTTHPNQTPAIEHTQQLPTY